MLTETLSQTGKDVRFAVRSFRRTPLVALVAVLSLGLGIAGNTAIFSLVEAFLFSPFPYARPDEVAVVLETNPKAGQPILGVTAGDFLDWRERQTSFTGLAAMREESLRLTGEGPPEQVPAAAVTPDFFELLGIGATVGRPLGTADGAPEAPSVVVVSHGLWQRRWGGDPGLVGKTVEIEGRASTVVGVLADGAHFGDGSTAVWRPLRLTEADRADRTSRNLVVVGRLRPGVDHAAAETEMAVLAARIEREHPDTNAGYGADVHRLRDIVPGRDDQILVSVLLGAVVFVLLIACANIANLLLARGEARRAEMAVRAALGAGGGRLVRQVLTESLVLAAAGGLLGVVLGRLGVDFLASSMPAELPRQFLPTLDGGVLAFTVLVTALAGLAFGTAPAFAAANPRLAETLHEGGRGGQVSRRRAWVRKGLVVGQVALAATLLAGAGALVRTFAALQPTDAGFVAERVLTVRVTRPVEEPATDSGVFFARAETRLRELPGVESVAVTPRLPRSRSEPEKVEYELDGEPLAPGEEARSAGWLAVGRDYFSTLGIRLESGRAFTEADREGAPPVAIVSRRFAALHWPNGSALGQRVIVRGVSREIVGVARDLLQRRIETTVSADPFLYLPFAQSPQRSAVFAIKTAGDPSRLAEPVRKALWELAPEQPLTEEKTLEAHLREMFAGPRAIASIVSLLGALALALATLGIYGVIAYGVALRRKEIGIRMALGARRFAVARMVTRQGATLVAVGVALAAPAIVGVLRLLAGLFERLAPSAVGSSLSALTVLVAAGLLASFLPARRAALTSPTETLRG